MHKRKEEKPPTDIQPLLLTIPQVAVVLGVHRSRVYTLIKRGGLPTVPLGGRGGTRVYRTSLQRWIEQLEQV